MDTTIAALFDLDGVIIDTEPQYSIFWDKTGAEYLRHRPFRHESQRQHLAPDFRSFFCRT